MSCSSVDLKAYVVGELAQRERVAADDHVRACQSCREELERLSVTRTALLALEDEEAPQRIAFVSDRVFEPRWWQTMWHSGPVMGFSSAAAAARSRSSSRRPTSSRRGTESSSSSRTGFSTISAVIMSRSSSLLSASTLTICTRPGVRICRWETFKCNLGCNNTMARSFLPSNSYYQRSHGSRL